MKKRVLSMLMALALCLTLLPAPVRAAEDTPEGGAIVQEEQEEALAAESPVISEQAVENGIAAQNGGDSTVENAVAEDTPEGGAIVQEEQEKAPAAESPAISEQAAENGIAVQDGGDSTVENAVAEVTINGKTTPYTDIDAAFAAAQQAGSATVKLLADVTISHDDYSGIALKKGNITLDLNGKTLSKSTRDDSGFFARNAVFWLSPPEVTTKDDFLAALKTPVRLTVQDNSTDGNGKIVQPNGGPAVIAPLSTILTVNGGTIENTSSVDLDNDSHMTPNCAVQLSGGGKAVINGGTLRGMRGVTVAGYITKEQEGLYKEYFGIEGYNNDTYGNELTVTDGNICATSGEALIVYKKAKKIELSGGIFTTQSNAYSIWVADTEAEGEPTIKGDASSLLASGYRYEYNGTECAYSEDGKGVAGNATVAPRPANEYAYIDKDGKLTTQANCTEITERTDDISTPGWYVLKEDITISLLNISGEVNLILCDGAMLTVTNYMNVTAGSTLNLFWQSAGSGKLTAAAISVLGNVTAPAGEMKQTTGEGGTTFEKCFEHDWGYTNNGDTHTAMCKLCGKAEAAESHKYDSWAPTNANTHTGTCACGATKTEDHTLTCTPNADGLTHSTKCSVCGYTAAAESHDFNQTDNYGKKCACGAYLAAECNGQQYATLARAIEAANGADITLLTIVSENVVVGEANIKAGVILGNGKTIDDIPYPSNWVADRNGVPLTMEAGEITLKNGALAQLWGDANANVAIELKGGTLTVADTVTKIIGSVASEYGQRAAIKATGGVLDLQGNTLLDGGLTMSGDARLKNKLTAGTFTNSGSESYSVSVEGSNQYTTVFDLLKTGYAFAEYDADNEGNTTGAVIARDTTTRELTEDVTVIKCTHKGANNKSLFKDNTCTGCGFTCAHETIENGICTVCNTAMGAQDNTGKYYLNLAEAFEGVADGGTVTMLTTLKNDDTISFCRDAKGNPVEKTVTFMMNGKSLSFAGAPTLHVESGKLIIGDEATISQTDKTDQPAVFVDNDTEDEDRGTLEFKGKANLTGGLLIQNWGKLVGGLKEGTIITSNGTYSVSVERSDTYGNVLGLLGDGLAFAKYDESAENKAGAIVDGSVKQLTEDVIVVAHTHSVGENNKCACGFSCTHGGTNGLDENATACPYCNALAVAETDLNDGDGGCRRRRFADLQTAIDADRDGGTTLQLLADVTGDYTIDGTRDTRLDLNGHRIKGTVTVKAAVGNNTTTFSNTQNTTTASIDVVVAYKGAKLTGSDYPAVIGKLTLADTTKWKDILQQLDHIGFMVKNTDGTHTWYAPDDIEGSQLNNVIINYDKAAPDWSGNESGIRIKSTWWNKLLSSVTFGLYKGSSLDVYAKANDSLSGVAEYYYYIDNSGSTTILTAEELANKSFKKVAADKNGTTKLTEITSDNNYVIYAYAVDAADNRSTYISSDGVVLDNTAPKLTNVSTPAKSNGTLTDTSATITFTGSEAGTYYYILEENGKTAPTVMSDFATKTTGDKVDTWTAKDSVPTGTLAADEGNTIKLTGLKANTSYVLYLAATDAVGNASVAESAGADGGSGVVFVSFTTTKTIPYVKTAPVLFGNYGDTVSAMLEKADITKASVTAGQNSDTKIEGTWTPASEDADEIPAVGTSEKYTLTFTPTGNDADIYDSVTCEVTPEISKKPIIVMIANIEKFYGDEIPKLTWNSNPLSLGGETYNTLVNGDTEEALGIRLSTTAKDNSNVGTYAITGLSVSANYEVSFTGSGSDGKSGVLTVKQAANSFTTALSCSGYIYAKDETPKPNAAAKFGTVTYKYAKADSDGNAPAADSAYTDAIPVNAGTYAVKAYVAETDNYAGLTSNPAVFTIAKAAKAPNMPENAMTPAHSTKKVGDIILPEGWNWQEADKDTALADGVAVTANAIYTGTDKGNYETESVSITITRSECDHTHTEIRNQREATCKEEGYTGDTYCKDCGEKLAAGTTIEKKPHKVGTPATCVSKAVCSVCSETFGEVDATNHVHTTVKNRKEATCTQTGYAGDTYCTDCDKLLSTGKELAALGHDYKATVTKQPTTTEEGIRTYTCTRCNSSYTESIAKLPEEKHTHNYTGSITKEATCTEAGVRTYTCSCGDSYTENIPATGHSYVSKVTKATTTTEEGIMTYTCSKCGHSYTQPIAMIKSDNSNKDNGSQNQKPQSGTDNGNQNQKPQPDTDNGKDNGTSIKPYIKDDSGKEGWDVIKPQLEEAKSGDTVTVAMNGTTVVPKAVIDSIKGKDTTLVLDMGNGLSWKIYGKDITDAAGDIDFDVTAGADAGKSIPVDVINNVTGERYSINLTLAYDGEFGFTATLTVNMESKNAGLYANLFYYNEQTGELEFISAGQIDPDGNVELVFTHASDYTIVVDTKIMSDNGQADNKGDETIPASKTDDSTSKYTWNNTIIIIIGICIMLIVIGAIFYVRKKSGSEE